MSRDRIVQLSDAAVAAVKDGNLELALRYSLELEGADPEDPSWPRRTAKVYRRLNHPKEEVDALNRAARLYERRGDYLKAATVSKQLLEIAPRHPETLQRIDKLRNAARNQPPGATTVNDRPAPAPTARGTTSWAPGQGLTTVALRDVMPGAERDHSRSDDSAEVYCIPLEDVVEEAPTPLFAAADPSALVTEQSTGFAVEDAAVLAVEEEFRAAERVNTALSGTSLFAKLPEDAFSNLLMAANVKTVAKEQEVFHQGDKGTDLFVVAEGTVGVVDEGPPRKGLSKLREGDFFGEMALLADQPRSATIVALTDVQLIAIDREMIRELIEQEPGLLKILLRFFRDRGVDRLLSTNPLFEGLSANDKKAVGRRFKFLEVDPGALLVKAGTDPTGLIVIISGGAEALVPQDGKAVRVGVLGPGDVVGEMSLLTEKPAGGTVRATKKCFAIELESAAFLRIVRARPQAMAFIKKVIEARSQQAQAVLKGRFG